MSLKIYSDISEIPSGMDYVKNNEKFFVGECLPSSEICRFILEEVEHAEYIDRNYFLGRIHEHGNLNISALSTGTKTLINILNHPDICFDICECGNNAVFALRKVKNGNILDRNGVLLFENDDLVCDILYHGHHFKNLNDYIKFREAESDGDK